MINCLIALVLASLVSAQVSQQAGNVTSNVSIGCTLLNCICGYHQSLPVVTYGKKTLKSIMAQKNYDGSIDVKPIYLWHTWDGKRFYTRRKVSKDTADNWHILSNMTSAKCSSTDFLFANQLQSFIDSVRSPPCKLLQPHMRIPAHQLISRTYPIHPFGNLSKDIQQSGPLVNVIMSKERMILTYRDIGMQVIVQGHHAFVITNSGRRFIHCVA